MKHLILLSLFWVSLAPLFAQNAKINGHIYDDKNGKMPYVTVMLLENGTIINGTYSDENGEYVFAALKPGTYSLKITLLGYTNELKNDIVLKEKEEKVMDVSLKMDTKLEEVVATGTSPAYYPTTTGDMGIAADKTELLAEMLSRSVSIDGEADSGGGADSFDDEAMSTTPMSPPPPPPAPVVYDAVEISAKKMDVSRAELSVSKSITRTEGVAMKATTSKGSSSAKAPKSAATYTREAEKKGKKEPAKLGDTKHEDIPVKDEVKKPIEKVEADPLTGKLTAGEVNDFSKWKLWKGIAKDEFKDFQNDWKMVPQERYVIQVENKQHHPMPNIKVELRSKDEVIWTGRTDNTGKAELWAEFFQQIPQAKGHPSLIRLYFDGKTQDVEQIMPFSRGINHTTIDKICEKNLQADIAFVVDATGSMGDEIAHIRADLSQIASNLKDTLKGWEVNFGSVFYQDQGDAYLTKSSPFSSDVKQTQQFMFNTPYGGGGDFPEAVESGLEEAVQKLKWNDNASTRIIFLVLDAPSHSDIETLIKLQMQIRAAAHKGIRIIPVACSGIDKSTEYLLRSIALATNGTYSFLTDDSGIGGSHIKPTTDDFKVEKFYQLAVRLVIQYTYQPDCEPIEVSKPEKETVFQTKIVEETEEKAKKEGDEIVGKNEENNKVWVKEKVVSWKYYPNPTKGDLTIEVEDNIGEIFLSDISGKVLERYEVKEGKSIKIDLSPYANGIYFLRYEYETDKWLNGKVILER